MSTGYIKISRSMFESEEWTKEKFTKAQAWIDLIGLASFKERSRERRGITVAVPRGSIAIGVRELAKRWQWNERTVMRYLSVLESATQITTQKTNVTTLISIVNYEKYQDSTTQSTTQNTTQSTTQNTTLLRNNDNKLNNFVEDKTCVCACAWKEVQMNSAWLESIQYCIHQRFQIIPTAEQIQQELEGFKAYQIASDTKYENIDVKRHFLNWLLNRIEQKQNETNRNISRDEQRKQEQDKRLQGYAAVAEAMLNGDYQVQDPTQVD